jgi:glutamine amidotransferase
MIIIIDYEIGNLTSIKNMIKKAGSDSTITSDVSKIATASKFILPGVGSFEYGIRKLRSMPYFDLLEKRVLEDKIPLLGICLGAQLLFERSEEGASSLGLGWIKGKVIKFNGTESLQQNIIKVPHMGWNRVKKLKDSKLTQGISELSRFYFVHSYHFVCKYPEDALFETFYGYPFVSGVENNNILGVQFHPEKSHKFGMKLYSNFLNNY